MLKNTQNQCTKALLAWIVILFGAVLISFGLGLSVISEIWPKTNQQGIMGVQESKSINESGVAQKEVLPSSIQLNTLFFGDVFWGRYVDDWSKASDLKYAYPFSGLNTFERDKYDAWIANLECPITTTYLTSAQQESVLKFSCLPEYTSEAAKWFSVFSLANNHMDNMQEVDGLSQTRENLEKNKIQYFGHYDNAVKQDICEVVGLEGRPVFEREQGTEQGVKIDVKKYTIPVALCGFHNVFKLPTQDELEVIFEYAKYFPTIVMPHQGAEYLTRSDSLQQSYFKEMIDLGADAVIGGHTHSVQETEAYKGKLIVYSMGNFIFDQQASEIVRTGIAVNLDFSFVYDENYEKSLQLGAECIKFKDDCLDRAKQSNLVKPSFSIKYDLMATDNSGKLAKKGDEKKQALMLDRTKWKSTLTGLN